MDIFLPSEFTCKCCGAGSVKQSLIFCLEKARKYAAIPFQITSGYRCEAHNKAIGGSPASAHLKGWAVDIRCDNDHYRYVMLRALLHAGFQRIEIADRHIHVDMDPTKTTRLIWLGKSR